MRKLMVIPIVHTPEDLGDLAEEVKKQYISRYGRPYWHQRLRAVEELWQIIRQRVLALPVDFCKVRLYQDGLPTCSRELEIVEKLSYYGSRNHQLLLELVQRGALLTGTESPALLVQERERLLKQSSAHGTPMGREYPLYDELIQRRDEYIGQRIDATLQEGETGLLFIGALHRVADHMSADIHVCEL